VQAEGKPDEEMEVGEQIDDKKVQSVIARLLEQGSPHHLIGRPQ
jgi:hypothetical protein